MRNATSGSSGRGRIMLGLAAAAVLAPSVWAYVNGGVRHTTRWDFERQLRHANWAVAGGKEFSDVYKNTKGIKVDPAGNIDQGSHVAALRNAIATSRQGLQQKGSRVSKIRCPERWASLP